MNYIVIHVLYLDLGNLERNIVLIFHMSPTYNNHIYVHTCDVFFKHPSDVNGMFRLVCDKNNDRDASSERNSSAE